MASTIVLNPLEQTFGLPPSTYVSDSALVNSMPVVEIIPCTPHFESGLTLFSVYVAWDKYNDILQNHGFKLTDEPIRLAFIADNFPTDSFTNEYGETFLQKFTDVASQGMQQLAQMAGAQSGVGAIENIGKSFQNIGKQTGGTIGDILGAGGGGAASLAESMRNLKAGIGGTSGFLQGSLNTIDKMLAGHRVDFPQIWRNSGFTPSYTVTVRLYNPNPGSAEQTIKHIIGPLAVILCLAIPRSDDGKTFNWPFFHKIKSEGIYNLSPGVITNITVVKGGDQQQISFNQKLGMVDVRIDFTSLYGTMILEEGKTMMPNRPTVKNYLDNLGKQTGAKKFYTRNEMRSASKSAAGASLSAKNSILITGPQESVDQQNLIAKNQAARNKLSPTVTDVEVSDRVSSSDTTKETNLTNQGPGDFYPSTTA